MSSPLRIAVIGAAGRMGQAIAEAARGETDISIVAQCSRSDSIASAMEQAEVAIDFSAPHATEEICAAAISMRRPLVIGTTGHSDQQVDAIRAASGVVAIVFASNFSIGVNALFWLANKAATILGREFKASIRETHHVRKKDAPSGTAKTLAAVLKATGTTDEIPIESIREGDVVGEHTVTFEGRGETLDLIHRAKSRTTFASGALTAARWVVDKPPGLYSMQDVLQL